MAARIVLLTLLWVVITGFDIAALPYGAVAVALATATGWALRPPDGRLVSPLHAVRFLAVLIAGIARTSVDVARRAFLPRDRMAAPAFVTYRLREPSVAGALGLSYAVTLMPGTVGAAIDPHRLDIHMLDRRAGTKDAARMEAALAGAIRRKSSKSP